MIDRVSKPEEQSVDSDYQTDKVWLLNVQRKLYQWSLENTRLRSNHWRAGGIAKGAYPVRREVRENRLLFRTASLTYFYAMFRLWRDGCTLW